MKQKKVVEIKSSVEKIKVLILKNNVFKLTLIFILSTFINPMAIAAEHAHHHAENEVKLSLNEGVKWPIDKSLHIGMTNIKTEIANNLDSIHHEKFTDEQYAVLATSLDKQLSFLFANCKLPPLADAQLHTLLAKVMQGVDKIKHSNSKKQGAVLIIQALQDYPVYFEDADWQNLMH